MKHNTRNPRFLSFIYASIALKDFVVFPLLLCFFVLSSLVCLFDGNNGKKALYTAHHDLFQLKKSFVFVFASFKMIKTVKVNVIELIVKRKARKKRTRRRIVSC